ncbi:AmmeMemoRadiSam system radical SAM enzyme [Desulfolucanica intricata]|uniref:AmmeMemoRadiSam system radical SAM enzyme n=1 Tax=Desulfolucanica intricata TaxID=1285191 RepID=UPI0008317C32|nr:AmmeMemoRadiSam system radical SAM enzyme [Desulfolucanica intricata]
MHEALFYEKKEADLTACRLCPKMCTIREGKSGFCRVRKNNQGTLYAINYGQCTAYALDPIEKKPLYHFYPGTYILSLGTHGCNLRCGFCQNWEIAHSDPRTVSVTPEQIVSAAKQQSKENCAGLAYTYSEPFMWYEFVLDTAKLARKAGLKNVLVTNGYINETPLRQLLPYIDAMNIDVKGFTDNYYKKSCAGHLEPVKRTVEVSAAQNCHVELTTLLVTGLNDSHEEINSLVDWVYGVDKNIPIHFSRYFPNYKLDLEPTPLTTLKMAYEIARKKLSYVYVGNAPELNLSDTRCPACGEVLIERSGYRTEIKGLQEHRCKNCSEKINILI